MVPKKPKIEDLFPEGNLGIYERFHLRNFNLTKHWEYTRAYKDRENVYMDIKKLRQLHIMITVMQKERSNMSQIGEDTSFSLQHLL